MLSKWVKPIGNHLWWTCATSEGMLSFYERNEWTGHNKFTKRANQKLTKERIKAKEWISPKSDAFEALQSLVICKNTLKDLAHLTQFCHTEVLEVYHAFYNKWAPKRQHFSYAGMLIRSQLAVMDFNESIFLGTSDNWARK